MGQASLRGLLLLFGLACAAWSWGGIESNWSTAPAREIASRILAEEPFKYSALTEMLERLKRLPQLPFQLPDATRAKAVILARYVEESRKRKGSEEADREAKVAEQAVRASLFLSPSDSLLWLTIYSASIEREGFDRKYVRYLDQSYAVGPNEGWIAKRRNRASLSAFSQLNDLTQRAVLAEFSAMVDSDFIEEAAINLMTVGWEYRDRLVDSTARADIASRQMLAKRLSLDAIDLKIPGVELKDRSWR